MRLLHTADWHAGRTLGRQNLDEGLRQALTDLVDYAIKENVDAVLLAGDVFEHSRPPASSQELVYEALLRLAREAKIPVVLVAGNHDSVGHWNALKPLFRIAEVHVAAALETRSVCTVRTRSGPLHVATLPWPTERLLAPLSDVHDQDSLKMQWADRVRQLVGLLCKNLRNDGPQVLLSHLMINGSVPSSSERLLSIADTYAVAAEIFPACLNYAALGHVHRPQAISAPVKAYYAGSLRGLDFGEAGQARGFYRVDVGLGKATEAEFIPLTPAQPLLEITLPLEALEHELPSVGKQPGFCKVIVELDSPEAGLADRVRQLAPNALIVQARLRRDKGNEDRMEPEKLLDPLETFRRFHETQYGGPPESELCELFSAFLEEVNHATA